MNEYINDVSCPCCGNNVEIKDYESNRYFYGKGEFTSINCQKCLKVFILSYEYDGLGEVYTIHKYQEVAEGYKCADCGKEMHFDGVTLLLDEHI